MSKTIIFVTATVFNVQGEAVSYTAHLGENEVAPELRDYGIVVQELTEEARSQAFEDFEQNYYGAIGCLVDVKKITLPDLVTIRTTTEATLQESDIILQGDKE